MSGRRLFAVRTMMAATALFAFSVLPLLATLWWSIQRDDIDYGDWL